MPTRNITKGKNDLILNVLSSVCGSLDQHLKNANGTHDERVVLSNLFDQSGKPVAGTDNKIVMMVANISHDTTVATYTPTRQEKSGNFAVKSPSLYVLLDVMFYANMAKGSYDLALAEISEVISFFQQNRFFTPRSLPDLDPAIKKLAFEMRNLDLLDVNHVLGQFGAKYLPSVMYKVRLLPFDGPAASGQVGDVQGVQP